MSRRYSTGGRKGRRNMTLWWIVGMAAVIVMLLYFQQTELLYVLSTVGVAVLLIIVAMADLAHAQRSASDPAPVDDAAAAAAGLRANTPATATRAARGR